MGTQEALAINIDCQNVIISIANKFGWNEQLEDDFISLAKQEVFLTK